MPDFNEFADEAKKLASEHPDQTDSGLNKAGQFADQKTGNRFDSQIQQGEQAARNYLGGQGQGQQQGQDQSQGGGQYGGGQGQGGYNDPSQSGDQGQGGYNDPSQSGDQGQGGYNDQNQGGQY